jgi:hypothetical protein
LTQKRTSPKPSPEPPANAAAAGVVTKVNRAQLAHARVVATFAKRIRAAFAHGVAVYYSPTQGIDGPDNVLVDLRDAHSPTQGIDGPDNVLVDLRNAPNIVELMAERLAAHVEVIVASYNVPSRVRPGVCERLAEHWSLDDLSGKQDDGTRDLPTILAPKLKDMECQAERAGLIAPRIEWPSNISLDDIRATLERSHDDDAKEMALSFREGRWFSVTPDLFDGMGKLFPGMLLQRPKNYTFDPKDPYGGYFTEVSSIRLLSSIYNPRIAALVAWAEKTFTEAHTRAGAFALPSTAVQRAALAHVSTGPKSSAWKTVTRMGGRRVFLRVRWEGKLKPVQLALSFTSDITETVLGAVLEELSDDGLLDWLVLHKMADEQGRTGEFRWTWERHRQLAGYDKRVREGWKRHDEHGAVVRVTDDDLRRACTRHLWQLTRAELFDEVDGKLARSPVGDGPFLAITAIGDPKGLRPDGDFTVALMAWNKVLYEGAHRDARAPHHTGIPSGIFNLRGPARRLAVFLCLSERMHRDDGMYVTLSETSLMLYAGIRGDGKPSRRHITDARRELARHLEAVHAAISDGSAGTWRTGPTGRVYDHAPARWRVERDLLGAAPDRPALRLDVPRTGIELKAWRDARQLSQREVAELLGVSERTIRTAEKAAAALLPRSFRDVDWGKRQVPVRAQLTRGPPVEGEDAGGDCD